MKKILGRHWNGLSASSLAIGFALAAGAASGVAATAAVPQVSPLTLASFEEGKPVDAKLSMTLNGQPFECSGKATLASFSILTCGDQRQAQVEFQSFNDNKDAVIAVYQSGTQEGYLYLAKLDGQTYTVNSQMVVITPGFGSVKLFSKYVYEPMIAGMVPESQVFSIIPQMADGLGAEFKLAALRDRVANREYSKYKGVEAKEEPKAELKAEPKVEPKVEPKAETPVTPPAESKSEEVKADAPAASESKDQNSELPAVKVEEKKVTTPKKERSLLPTKPLPKKEDKKVSEPKQLKADPNEVIVDQKPRSDRKQTGERQKDRRQKERPKKRLSKRERERLEERRRFEAWFNEQQEIEARRAEERAYQRQRNYERQRMLEEMPIYQNQEEDLFGIPDWE